ncbi:nitrogen regulation protein NR(I) [Verminephrobacter eiseniae]|uniref:nitrogen regulation protein NR(I) n=2 Tax=Verminephrobacter eiseniae TaxID=364317 RepID=UPI002238AF17|nr:nitrogen regulation protein NR(I) [Verminephrobacter eiseniae]MCW5231544.1 nitrogen regulation protein NR(I) [Verminephrobacter eiseniae]MCW8225370.1 nitrogen regulation protein NR(I) [Verminephrobacter eiseniae]
MKPIWIVDDDPSIRFVLEKALARENLPTRSFTQPREVLDALTDLDTGDCGRQGPQVLVSDIRMPGGSGLLLLEKVRELQPGLPIIIMTAYSDLDSAVSAFQRGAFEYLPKPFDLPKAVALIRRAVEESQREEVTEERQGATPEILGQAPAMQDLFRAIGRLSQSQVTVLITGESGSGKELVARALHKHSPCADGPFVAINTAAIPKDLLESELFGHERGAFTGAQTQRRGRFEQAEGGTLFLDEIGDMPFDLQTRLLRVLSDGQFYRVGGHAALKAHVRVIAATHQDLEKRVKAGSFREDLFHRLNVIRLRLPALRERREDVPMLTRHFLQQSARQLGVEPKRIADSALARLEQFAFPGNVRQLENICHWLTVMAPAQVISLQDLPPEVLEAPAHQAAHHPPAWMEQIGHASEPAAVPATAIGPPPAEPQEALPPPVPATVAGNAPAMPAFAATSPQRENDGHRASWEEILEIEAQKLLAGGQSQLWDALTRRFESCLIRTALHTTHGRRMEAAQRLGIGRNTITRKIQELGLDSPDEA